MLKKILAVILTALIISSEAIPVDAAGFEVLPDDTVFDETGSEDTGLMLQETEETFQIMPAHSGEEIAAAEEERERSALELGYVPGEILVLYEETVPEEVIEETADHLDGAVTAVIENTESTLAVVEISEETTVGTAVEEYMADAGVITAEPNFILLPMDEPGLSAGGFDYLSAICAAGEDGAFVLLDDSITPVDVGIIDTGFDTENAAIAEKVSSDSIQITDASGGYTALTATDGTHGTNVAGILAAAAGPVLRELVLVDASEGSEGNYLTVSAVAAAISYLTPRVKVINMSIGAKTGSTLLAEAVDNAYRNGVTIICAAGNDGPECMTWPAGYENTVSVMASDGFDGLWEQSGSGDICAPGTEILCADGNVHNGTSLSAAMTGAAAAVLLSVSPNLSFPQIREILLSSADTSGSVPMLNMAAAIRFVLGTQSGTPDLADAEVNTELIRSSFYSEDWTDDIVLTYHGAKLNKDTDYAVLEESITESTEGETILLSVILKGLGSYTGSIAVETETNKRDVSDCTYRLHGSYQTDGTQVRPEVILSWEGPDHLRSAQKLTEGTDYRLTYGENTAAGESAGTILVTGLGHYCGSREIRFDIYAPDEAVGTVPISDSILCHVYPDGTLYFEGSGDMPVMTDEKTGRLLPRPYQDYADPNGSVIDVYKVIIGEGITSVAGEAFEGFTDLREVILPDSLNAIGEMAFYECKALKSVTFPENLSAIGWYAFAYSGLETAVIPDGVKPGQEVFYCCRSLQSLRLPADLKTIEMGLCEFCSSLCRVRIPEGVQLIENFAFDECPFLEAVELPESVEQIGEYAFSGVSEIYYRGSEEQWEAVRKGTGAVSVYAIVHFESEMDLFPVSNDENGDNETGSDENSGNENGNGENSNSETGGENSGNESGSSENNSENNGSENNSDGSKCGDNAFWSLDSEGTLTIRGTGAVDPYWADDYAWNEISDQIRTVVIKEGITDTGEASFAGLESLTAVSLPDSLQSVGSYAFADCINLSEIRIPPYVTEIREKAFYGCSGLTQVEIQGKHTGASWTQCLEKIKTDAFAWCESLRSINLNNATSLRSIGTRAFENCISLQELDFPRSLNTVGNYAFYNCTSLKYGHFYGFGIKKIGKAAFGYCTSLQNVSQYGSLETLGDAAFIGCTSLEHAGIMTNSAPLARIGAYAFYNCIKLEQIDFTENLKTIGDYAFYGSGIIGGRDQQIRTEVTLGTKLESVGRFAFANCINLYKVRFQGTDTAIGAYAFYNDPKLKTVLLPANLTRLEDGTFAFCDALTSPKASIKIEKGQNVFTKTSEGKDLSDYDKVPAVKVSMTEGSTMTLKGYSDQNAEVFSSDETIVSVLPSAGSGWRLHANAPGTAWVVYAGSGGRSAKWKVLVQLPEEADLEGAYKETGTWQSDVYNCSHTSCRTIVARKASCTLSGLERKVCLRCGKTVSTTTIPSAGRIWLSYTSISYSGGIRKPGVTIRDSRGRSISSDNYTITYSNPYSKDAGSYTVTVRFRGSRYTGSKTLTYRITKVANKITGVTVSKTLKASALKTGNRQFVIAASVKEGAAKTFSLSSVPSKVKSYISVSSAGKVTVKKGIPKGTYTIKVKITASATKNYNRTSVTKSIQIIIN